MIKAIIFDFDGVIGDTYDIALSAFRTFSPELTEEEFKDLFSGNLYKKIGTVIQPADLPILFERIREKTTKEHIFPLGKVLEELSQKYRLFIVSSTSDENIHHHLALCDMAQFFEKIFGATAHTSKVEKFKTIFRDFDLSPLECFFVTDAIGDIRETRDIGIKTIAVTWGYHGEASLFQEHPFTIAHDADELGQIIRDSL